MQDYYYSSPFEPVKYFSNECPLDKFINKNPITVFREDSDFSQDFSTSELTLKTSPSKMLTACSSMKSQIKDIPIHETAIEEFFLENSQSVNKDDSFLSLNSPSMMGLSSPVIDQFETERIYEEEEEIEMEMTNFAEAENFMRQRERLGVSNIMVTLEKKLKNKPKKNYEHKNVLKIFGQKCVALILGDFYENRKINYLQMYLTDIVQEIQFETQRKEKVVLSVKDFKLWLKNENIKKIYTKMCTFREFWQKNSNFQNYRTEVYHRLLTKITKKFLEEDVYHIFLENKGPKPIKKEEKIFGYLQKVPVLLRGMEDPEHFTHLDDE